MFVQNCRFALFSWIFMSVVTLNVGYWNTPIQAHALDGVPTVTDTVSIEFATAEEASKAMLTPMELPIGKTLALSSRWDDSNWDHRFMNQTLHENGWKGTFYLNRADENYVTNVVKGFVENGSSVGAHTNNHPSLNLTTPNAFFYQILNNRVTLESATNQCVVGFTFPNGLHPSCADSELNPKLGQCLVRSGLLTIAEPEHVFKELKLDKSEIVACWLFRADDKNPQQATFDREFGYGMDRLKAGRQDYCGPYFVLGIHAWQKQSGADGFERLSKILATQANRPDVWYCNNNQYSAYRLTYLNCKIKPVGISDDKKTVRFEITRPAPFALGATVEQGFQVTPVPKSVNYKENSMTLSDKGEFMLPANGNVPQIIGLANQENEFVSQKISDIRFEIHVDLATNRIHGSLKNMSGTVLDNAHFTFRLPLKWETGVIHKSLKELINREQLSQDEEAQFCFPLSQYSSDPQYSDDALYFVGQMDFCQGEQKRLYCETQIAQPFEPKSLPRDTAMFVGCLPETDLTDETFAPLSVPKTALKSVSDTPFGQWRNVVSNAQNAAYVVEAAPQFENKVQQPSIVYGFEFTCPNSDSPTTCILKTNLKSQMKYIWLNGKRIELDKDGSFTAEAGLNRILIGMTDGWTYYIRKCEIYISTQDGKPVVCSRPERE